MTRGRPAPAYVDVALALVFTVVGLLEPARRTVDGFDDGPLWLTTAICTCTGLLLVLRRRAPAACLLGMCAATGLPALIVPHGDYFWSQLLPLCLAVYPAARQLDGLLGRFGWLLALAAVEADLVHSQLARAEGGPGLPLVLFGGCALAARISRRISQDAAALADTLERLGQEQAARERAAVEEDRARFAAEAHDVVAHAVSVMVVQVGAARVGLEQQGCAVPDQLRAAESTGREALGELRRSLGVLRDQDDRGPLQPLPGLADLEDLARRFRDVGLEVDLTVDDDLMGLPVGLQLSVFRIVQEALTNALRHAGAVPVTASVTREQAHVVIAVDNALPARSAAGPGGGHGLRGMRERVEMYGGQLDAGPTGAGFSLRARLPLLVAPRPPVGAAPAQGTRS